MCFWSISIILFFLSFTCAHTQNSAYPHLWEQSLNITWSSLSCPVRRGKGTPPCTAAFCFCVVPLTPPSLQHASTLPIVRKSPTAHESSSVMAVRWVWDHTADDNSLFSPLSLSPVLLLRPKCGGMAAPRAYISVDGEINQIISRVRKRAQRGPSWSSFFEM